MIDIDFLWVGEKQKTGDAITCQFTDPSTGQDVVVVIDGGFRDDGERIASHVRRYYGTDRVDLAICTHPDDDHIRGLFGLIEELDVSRLLIHRPSHFGYTGDDVKAPLVDDLIATARAWGTTVDHGFTGTTYFGGALTIAGPSESYYQQLLDEQVHYGSLTASIGRAFSKAASSVMEVIRSLGSDPGETMTDDNGGTTPRNNSSIITDLSVDGYRALFTGDAGVPALNQAADYLDLMGKSTAPDFFDVPHHGSRHNLDPQTLDRLLGPIVGDAEMGSAFVSVGKEADDHPRPEVANAIRRRGYPVRATRGQNIRWNRGGAYRPEYGPIGAIDWLAE
ncbi:ComEC/Rec2 family competence protein [Geodermatophilus sp. CPCC 205761]|uniref:ComEC/Rec2 family competence protein n=1 Tax=Geodermatophilus sp. CPCC 205761 TaxID=2936597 RepID=UPI003EEB5607